MNTNYKIKNFRVFDENGIDITLSPITILTGCNSSGKSSIVKSIFLLDSFLSEIKKAYANKEEIILNQYKLDFSKYPNNLLGRFDKVVNSESKEKKIIFEYTIYSLILSQDLTVKLVFAADDNDELNNGFLDAVTISNEEGEIFSSINGEGNSYNLQIIKDSAIDFLAGEFTIHNLCKSENEYCFEDYESRHHNQIQAFKEIEKRIGKDKANDIFEYVLSIEEKKSIISKLNIDKNVLDSVFDSKQAFDLPILSRVKSAMKENIQSIFNDLLTNTTPDNFLNFGIQKIIQYFTDSEYMTFGEYYAAKAENFLSKIFFRSKHPNPLVTYIHTPRDLDFLWESHLDYDVLKDNIVDGGNILSECTITSSFLFLYNVLVSMDSIISNETKKDTGFYHCVGDGMGGGYCVSNIFFALTELIKRLVREALTPSWVGNFSYISSSRIKVQRLYALDDEEDFTHLLKKYFEARRVYLKKQSLLHPKGLKSDGKYKPDSFMNKWVKLFGIGQSISMHIDEEGLGVQIRLNKDLNSKGKLLADEGYGISQLFSILLQIETSILSTKHPQRNDNYIESQFLHGPHAFRNDQIQTIAIEEPEIHLHPKYQSLLADMFNDAFINYNIHFIIETHSEYLIRKEQVLVSDKDLENHIENDVITIKYVNSGENIDEPRIKTIGICKDGYLDDSFGTGFFDEATSLSRRLL